MGTNSEMPNVNQKFQKEKLLGEGAYGRVYSAHDGKGKIAVKSHLKDRNVLGFSSAREMGVSYRLVHPYILNLHRITIGNPFSTPASPLNRMEFDRDKLHFVYDMAVCNLKEYLKRKRSTIQYLEIKNFMMDIMMGVDYIHKSGYMHLDLKPENILLYKGIDGDMHIKISDFGLATVHIPNHKNRLGVTTSWYRAPEICLGYQKYDYKADMWAVGCIFYEMMSGFPLFTNVSNDDLQILSCIALSIPYVVDYRELTPYDSRGYARSILWKHMQGNLVKFFNLGEKFMEGLSPVGLKTFYDFMSLILCVNPGKRMTASEALAHPFFINRKTQINNIQECYKPKPYLQIPACVVNHESEKVRKYAMSLAVGILCTDCTKVWCTLQIVFHAIYAFDRAIYLSLNQGNCRLFPVINGHISITKERAELYLISCVYMYVKYFTMINSPVPFATSFDNKYRTIESKSIFESFEQWMTSTVYNYDIYEHTVYEEAFSRGITEKQDLLSLCALVIYGKHKDKTPAQTLVHWHQHKQEYVKLLTNLNLK